MRQTRSECVRQAAPGGLRTLRIGAALLGLLPVLRVQGQIGIAVEPDRQKYLRYEPIRVRVLLRNYSGNLLVFGSGKAREGRLDFIVETDGGLEARRLDRAANLTDSLILGAGETKELNLVLNNLYDMQKEGVYTVAAQLGHRRLPNDYLSTACVIEVRDGIEVWSRNIGLPTGGSAANIPARKVSLMLFHQNPNPLYCLKLEDAQTVYCVARLGPRIMGGDPACDVDAVSNTHVLFQIKSRLYKYCVYDYNGVLKQDRFYLPAGDVPPRLHRDPDIGRIMILGGRIGVPGIDFALTDTQGDEALNNQRRQLREADREAPAVGTDGVQAPASGRGDEQPAAAPATGPVIEKKKGWGRLRFWDRSQP